MRRLPWFRLLVAIPLLISCRAEPPSEHTGDETVETTDRRAPDAGRALGDTGSDTADPRRVDAGRGGSAVPLGLDAGAPRRFTPDGPPKTWIRQRPEAASNEPNYRTYSGATAGSGFVFYWGASPNYESDGNDVDAYMIAADRWVQLTEEETEVDANDKSPRGRPPVRQSFAQTTWWPGHGLCLLELRLWCYDPAKGDDDGAWTVVSSSHPFNDFDPGSSPAPWTLTYDPKLDTVVAATGIGNSDAFVWKPNTKSWNKVLQYPGRESDAWSNVYSAYSPTTGWHVVYAGQKWHRMNFNKGEHKQMTQLRNYLEKSGVLTDADVENGTVEKDYQIGTFSITWAPELERVLVADKIKGQLRLWTYDPATDAWADFQLEGNGPTDAHASWDTLVRDPLTGVYVFLARSDTSTLDTATPQTWTFWLRRNN